MWLDWKSVDEVPCAALGRKPGFILSFHEDIGSVTVVPLLLASEDHFTPGLLLPDCMYTCGVIAACTFRIVDCRDRRVEFIEKAPKDLSNKVENAMLCGIMVKI